MLRNALEVFDLSDPERFKSLDIWSRKQIKLLENFLKAHKLRSSKTSQMHIKRPQKRLKNASKTPLKWLKNDSKTTQKRIWRICPQIFLRLLKGTFSVGFQNQKFAYRPESLLKLHCLSFGTQFVAFWLSISFNCNYF